MKRSVRRILLALLLVCVYLLWHPEPTRQELVVDAAWALRPQGTDARGIDAGSASLFPVRVDATFAYGD
mgnify:CR=1 FL=1